MYGIHAHSSLQQCRGSLCLTPASRGRYDAYLFATDVDRRSL